MHYLEVSLQSLHKENTTFEISEVNLQLIWLWLGDGGMSTLVNILASIVVLQQFCQIITSPLKRAQFIDFPRYWPFMGFQND